MILEQVKDVILVLKETKGARRLPLPRKALAKKQREVIKKWAGTKLGPGFSSRERETILSKT